MKIKYRCKTHKCEKILFEFEFYAYKRVTIKSKSKFNTRSIGTSYGFSVQIKCKNCKKMTELSIDELWESYAAVVFNDSFGGKRKGKLLLTT